MAAEQAAANVEVTDQEIESRLDDIQHRFDSRKKFERALLEQHVDEQVRQQVQQAIARAFTTLALALDREAPP